MTTATINGKTYNIMNHVYKTSYAKTLKNYKEHAAIFKALNNLTGQNLFSKSISVIDIDSGLFYSNISLGNYGRRTGYSNKVYNSIVTEKGYAESTSYPELNYSPIYHENIVGHRFVFAIDCSIEYLEDIYVATVYRGFGNLTDSDELYKLFKTICEKRNIQNHPVEIKPTTPETDSKSVLTPEKVMESVTVKKNPLDIVTSEDYNNPYYSSECYSSIYDILNSFRHIRETMDEVEERLVNGGVVFNDDITYLSKHTDRAVEAIQLLIYNEIIEEKKIIITKGKKEAVYDETGVTLEKLLEILG